eukprot:218706_1
MKQLFNCFKIKLLFFCCKTIMMSLESLLTLFLLIIIIHLSNSSNKTIIEIHSITTLNGGTTGTSIIPIQRMVLHKLNNSNNMLPNHTLKLCLHDAEGESVEAMAESIKIKLALDNITSNKIISPIVLGCPWSAFSWYTSRALELFHFSQISCAATSVQLSKRKSFFRTIVNDALQGNALVQLCKTFHWTEFGVIYANDNYGINLNKVIELEAAKYNFTVHSRQYIHNDSGSINDAAQFIKNSNIAITILIVKGSDIKSTFDALNRLGLWGFPYFYIGVDSWYDKSDIKMENITNYVNGYVGTFPGYPALFTPNAFEQIYHSNDSALIYNKSVEIHSDIMKYWTKVYKANKTLVYNRTTPEAFANYAYDATMVLIRALDIFDRNYSLNKYLIGNNSNLSFVSEKLKTIIINDNFFSATGKVNFDNNGDRLDGFWVFGNFYNGSMNIIGGVHQQNESIVKLEINQSNMHWPDDFKNRIPLSSLEPKVEREKIHKIAFGVITFSAIVSLILALSFVFKACISRRHQSKLDFIMCFGCIMSYIGIIVYGMLVWCVDKYDKYTSLFDIGCSINLYIFCMVFTLSIIPLFARPYLFHKILRDKGLGLDDNKLSDLILKALGIDIVILFIFGVIEIIVFYGYNVKLIAYQFKNSGIYGKSDDGEDYYYNVYFYPQCVSLASKWSEIMIAVYCVILIYKFLEMYHAMAAFQGKPFFCIVCSILMAYFCTDSKYYISMTIHYCVVSVFILITTNSVIVLPRVYGIFFDLELLNKHINDQSTTKDDHETTTQTITTLNPHKESKEVNCLMNIDLEKIKHETTDETEDAHTYLYVDKIL